MKARNVLAPGRLVHRQQIEYAEAQVIQEKEKRLVLNFLLIMAALLGHIAPIM